MFLSTVFIKTYEQLKIALINEFERKVSSAEAHNELSNRKRKQNEGWQQYLFLMQEIAYSANIDDSNLIQYDINGINDSIQNKTIFYNANSISQLKEALRKYDIMKQNTSVSPNTSVQNKRRDFASSASNKITKAPMKCYNCNQESHVFAKCPQPRRQKGSCYRCGKFGHLATSCPEHSISVIENFHNFSPNHNFEKFINFIFLLSNQAKINYHLLTLLDSASTISLIQGNFVMPAARESGSRQI
ncbi:uncharacterized protein LOC129615946 [Condylostylus longicornis]|uniref:uncharacterized protein LOC129615946 n=1 Tax=Condylostylus longicornis TaxID=2530218 RepID=UPI00244DB2BD|nr:uncharacterized protein LOC129615946 [Condylostylus longicornis]